MAFEPSTRVLRRTRHTWLCNRQVEEVALPFMVLVWGQNDQGGGRGRLLIAWKTGEQMMRGKENSFDRGSEEKFGFGMECIMRAGGRGGA